MSAVAAPIQDSLDTAKLQFIDVMGRPTRYFEDGAGEPLVLFHGGQYGSLYSLDAWSMALPGLAQSFHVFAVDKLGQGFTAGPATAAEYTFETLVEHSIAFLDALGIRNAHLAGHSRGALLIAAIALARPDLVKSLICVSTNTLAPDDPRYPGAVFYAEVAKRTPPGPPTAASVRMEPDAQAYDNAQVTDDFVARLLDIAQDEEFQRVKSLAEEVSTSVFLPSLAGVKARVLAEIDARGLPAPTIIIWGADDKSAFVPLASALFERIRAKTPRTSLHIVNHSGHYVFREQTGEFLAIVKGFCLA